MLDLLCICLILHVDVRYLDHVVQLEELVVVDGCLIRDYLVAFEVGLYEFAQPLPLLLIVLDVVVHQLLRVQAYHFLDHEEFRLQRLQLLLDLVLVPQLLQDDGVQFLVMDHVDLALVEEIFVEVGVELVLG